MPKTYNTIPTTTTGSVYTAAAHNNIVTNVNNYRVPPSCHVYRSSNLTGYSSAAKITWNAEAHDTDDMWTSGTDITIKTAGIYLIVAKLYVQATATLTYVAPEIGINAAVAAQFYNASVFAGTVSQGMATYVASLAVNDTVWADAAIAGGSAYIVAGGTLNTTLASSLSVTWLGQVS
jgi:hypothetical protein